jgi:hypothetical protein
MLTNSNAKAWGLLLLAILVLSSSTVVLGVILEGSSPRPNDFYFGVSYGGSSAEGAKPLIEKVKGYTNIFLIASYDITGNETELNEICNYCVQSNLKFIVYFQFISRIFYPWHQVWMDTAKQRFGSYFLGVYLQDELGGKQIDGNSTQKTVLNASSYTDAANQFVNNIAHFNSTQDAKRRDIPLFIADYALYWFDYQAGYDTVFAELGSNASVARQIALCRGAADMQGKDWGAILTWKYEQPPYMPSAGEMFNDMVSAYLAGAKYVLVFNYPTYPDDNPYGVLSEEDFAALQQFWHYINTYPRESYGVQTAQAALVLPADYGWAMRRSSYITSDSIWGLFPEDSKAPMVLNSTNTLVDRYGLKLDIVYDDARYNVTNHYGQVYYWNSTLT